VKLSVNFVRRVLLPWAVLTAVLWLIWFLISQWLQLSNWN
jgi:hypothetical protein